MASDIANFMLATHAWSGPRIYIYNYIYIHIFVYKFTCSYLIQVDRQREGSIYAKMPFSLGWMFFRKSVSTCTASSPIPSCPRHPFMGSKKGSVRLAVEKLRCFYNIDSWSQADLIFWVSFSFTCWSQIRMNMLPCSEGEFKKVFFVDALSPTRCTYNMCGGVPVSPLLFCKIRQFWE